MNHYPCTTTNCVLTQVQLDSFYIILRARWSTQRGRQAYLFPHDDIVGQADAEGEHDIRPISLGGERRQSVRGNAP